MNVGAFENQIGFSEKYFYPIYVSDSADSKRNTFINTIIINNNYWKSITIYSPNTTIRDWNTFFDLDNRVLESLTLRKYADDNINVFNLINDNFKYADCGNEIRLSCGSSIGKIFHRIGAGGTSTEIGFSVGDARAGMDTSGNLVPFTNNGLGSISKFWSDFFNKVWTVYGYTESTLPTHYPGRPIVLYRSDLGKLVLWDGAKWVNVDGTAL